MKNHVFGHFLSFFCHFLSFFHEKFHFLTTFLGYFQFFWFFFKPENSVQIRPLRKTAKKSWKMTKNAQRCQKRCHFWTQKWVTFEKKGSKMGHFWVTVFKNAQKVSGSFYLWKKSGVKKSGDFLVFKKNHLQISKVSIFVTALIKWH